VMLLAYSAGLGLPFLLLALGFGRDDRLGWLRRHSRHIEIAGGALLVVMGVAVITGDWTRLMSDMLAMYARLGWPPL
jgi:cytochrome c-type biogenesis protein